MAASEDGGREVAAAGRHLTEASATRIDPASSPSIHAARTSLDVTQLADHAAGMDLPFNVNTACGSRAYGILSEFRRLGVPPEELGIAHSVIPDASAAGLERAYATGQIMYNPARLTPSFSERLRANIGQVITPGETVEFEGARFTLEHYGEHDIVAIGPTGSGRIRRVQAPGRKAEYGNHTAAMVGNKVIDPSISPNPMSLKEWMEGQNYPDAIVMTGRMSDEAGSGAR